MNETMTLSQTEIEEMEEETRIGLYEAIETQIKNDPDIPTDVLVKIAKLLASHAK